tara:strand:+ start:330 stop:527 length:198 start_codon:yes stop_codon:yes gene_type:complete
VITRPQKKLKIFDEIEKVMIKHPQILFINLLALDFSVITITGRVSIMDAHNDYYGLENEFKSRLK